jgi:GDP-L-fucose synthase
MNKNSRIFVAGHKGLVGSAIMENLKMKKFNNIIVKDFSELDIRITKDVEAFFEVEKPDYVFLAAAKVGGIHANNTYRAEFIYDNLMIQNNVIHCSYLFGVKKLLFLGSTCIYPKNCEQPMKEEYLLNGELEYTNEPYAIAKIAGIKTCESYNLQYNTDFICVMPTNLYGPNDNFDLEKSHVLPALIRKIYLAKCIENSDYHGILKDIKQNPLENVFYEDNIQIIIKKLEKYGIHKKENTVSVEIWGTGKPLREFLWSEEMADACVYIMENITFKDLKNNKKEIKNTHINIGTGEEISIYNLAFLIKKIIGFNGELFFNDSKHDGTMRKLTDISKLNSLGWKHKINIEEGLNKLYYWYISNLNNYHEEH